MANLTNSGKLITKIEAIDSSISSIQDKIGSIPEGTDIGQEIADIETSIGTLPEGKTVVEEIASAKKAGEDAAAAVASDLSAFETDVANTYATKDSVASAFLYKGTKETYAELPTTDNKVGDVWNIEKADSAHNVKAGDNVVWNGESWDVLAGIVDLSNYYTKSEIDTKINDAAGDITALEGRMDTAEGKIATLEGKASTAESDITAIKGRLDTAESDIDAVENRATTLESKMTTAEGKISTAEGKISTLESDVDSLEEAVDKAAASLPFEGFYVDATFSGKTAVVSNEKIKADSQVASFVVKSGALNGYYIEREVEAGKLTLTSSDAETATLRVLVINEVIA